MTMDTSFALVMSRLRDGDPDAAEEVFRRYVHRLIALASRQFDARVRSKEDPEDVVQSAYRSFFRRDVRAPFNLADWEGLWALLATITVRKCIDRRQFWRAARRDAGRELDVRPGGLDGGGEWLEAIARGPTPEQALMLEETLELLTSRLDPAHREIAGLSFEGHSSAEIAARCCCSERTVGRVVARLRDWLLDLEADSLGG